MNESLVIIRHTSNEFISKNIEKNGYKVIQAFKSTNYFSYLIWKALKKYNLPWQSFWYNDDLKNMEVKTIILIESMLTKDFVHWVRVNNPNARIIFWYWNIVKNTIDPKSIDDTTIEKWSFSEKDCKEYGIEYNPPFFFNSVKIGDTDYDYDLYFVGKDKGRLPMLLNFKKEAEKLGISTHLHVSPTKKIDLIFNHKGLKPAISYEHVLVGLSKSKAILDIIEVTDSGQSQRAMESIFFEKKLVTNSKLIKNFDFYNSNNIFILDEDNISDLPEFLEKPYVKIDRAIVERYDVNNWIKRFFK